MANSMPAKTIQSPLLAWQSVANGVSVLGSALNCSSTWFASIGCRLGRGSATAFNAGWPNIRIEVSYAAAGNDHWIPLTTFQPPVGTSVGKTTLNGAIIAGATSLVLTSATNFVQGDILFLGHVTLAANYEVCRVLSISGTTVTLEEPCTYAHSDTSVISNQAFIATCSVDLRPFTRIRAVADNANSGIGISIEVVMITTDSFGV